MVDLSQKAFASDSNSGFMKVNCGILPEGDNMFTDAIENFEIRDDDVWVCSFPKAGTTWVQEMVWCIANNLDFERARVSIHKRFPSLKISTLLNDNKIVQRNTEISDSMAVVSQIAKMPSPRFIKAHLTTNLLPRELRDGDKKAKIIYVARNAKDTCISYFHYCKLMHGFEGSLKEFSTLFLTDTIFFAPHWKHVLGFWNKRNHPNVLFLRYEDMKKDLPSVIRKTALFLGEELSENQVSLLSQHLSFSSMKNNPAVNWEDIIEERYRLKHQMKLKGSFMRSGTTEQWRTEMTPEMIKRFDDWIDEHLKEFRDRDIYKKDGIGLKTLDLQGKLKLHVVPGIPHFDWDKIKSVDGFVLPYLD